MTESEWIASTSPERMLQLMEIASERKLRLFAVACARRLNHLSGGEFAQRLVAEFGLGAEFSQRLATAERFADGNGSHWELKASWEAGLNICVLDGVPALWSAGNFAEAAAGNACNSDAEYAALWAVRNAQEAVATSAQPEQYGETLEGPEHQPQAELLRDILGNPYRRIVFSQEWRTPTAVMLAQHMYDFRDFSAMPVLADALQEAGCSDSSILDHCRDETQVHVRGCWVLDLVLGKA